MMPRIGITCYPSQGGSGVVATELGLHLSRRGCEVHFISSDLPFRLRKYRENIVYHPVEMPHYPVFQHSPYTLSLATAMHDVATRYSLDILHVHYAIPHAASAYLARQMLPAGQVKVVTTLHGTDITLVGQEPSFFPITRFLIDESDAVTAVSDFLKKETVRVFETGQDIEVIPNFVDPRIFKPRAEHPLRDKLAPHGQKLIMHASNFRPVKNPLAVVEVFAQVRKSTACRLVMVGEGPEAPSVRKRIEELGLAREVDFLGQVDNLEEVLPAADVLLLPSLHESFGLVGLEAMACGVVPILTSRGGAPEFIQDGITGYLRDPEDIQGMAEAAVSVLMDDVLRENLVEEGVRVAAADFGASCVVRMYLDLYDRVLGIDGSGRRLEVLPGS